MSGILSAIWNGETPGEEKKQELAQYCRHSSDMVEEAVRVFERVSLNRAWYQRLVENREVIAEQLDAMAYIMQDLSLIHISVRPGSESGFQRA